MVETITVPRVFRPLDTVPDFGERLGNLANEIAGVTLDFDCEEVQRPDVVALGTGEMVRVHFGLGAFSCAEVAADICTRVQDDMPRSFSRPIRSAVINELRVRSARENRGQVSYLYGTIRSHQAIHERLLPICKVSEVLGARAEEHIRAHTGGIALKLAEIVGDADISHKALMELRDQSRPLKLDLGPGVVEAVDVEVFRPKS